MRKLLLILLTLCLQATTAMSQNLADKYNAEHPLIIVGDWDKPPYEFLNDQGQPAGINIDMMKAICNELGLSYKFQLKEWSGALKAFERGDADIILANGYRYKKEPYYRTHNVINYNRICAAMVGDTVEVVSTEDLLNDGVALKPGDYSAFFFRGVDSLRRQKIEFQPPKVALQGLMAGDYKYFVWGEEPLRWKIKELNLKGIVLSDVQIPVSEIRIVGYDQLLIYEIDDVCSRLKQSGEAQEITDRWIHPDRIVSHTAPPLVVYAVLAIIVLAISFYGFSRIARRHVQSATRNSSDLNNMMLKALHMGNFYIMQYDIKNDRWTNSYGTPILPEKGITLQQFIDHIQPSEAKEFTEKLNKLLSGRERKFELLKHWRVDGQDNRWLTLEGHAMVEYDDAGQPAYIINALNDVTRTVEEERLSRELACKYQQLSNIPFVAMSFYTKEGWLIDMNDAMRSLCGITDGDAETLRYWTTVNMFDIPMFRNAYSPDDRHDVQLCQHLLLEGMGIDCYIEFHIRPLFDSHGQLANYFISALNISDERQADYLLHQHQRQMHSIEKSMDRYEQWLNFLTKGGNTFLWYSNIDQQTAWYYRSLRAQGKDYVVMPFATHVAHMPAEERAQALALYNSHEPFDSVQHFNSTVINGGESWFHIIGKPIIDAQGHVVGHRGQSIDITQEMATRLRLEKEELLAKESVRLKSAFLASMTHELRTPLNAIIGFTDVLAAIDKPEERAEYIRIIRTNCDMLQRLINDILTATSLSETATSIQEEDVDFSKEFNDICIMLQQRVENGVDFIKENPYHTFYTRLDKGRVAQVLTNFVTNAVKFTKEGYIKVGYSYSPCPKSKPGGHNGLYLYCTDTGTGIPEDKQEVIFNRFVKLDEFVQGTGMGLNICKSIAERCGGRVGVESRGPGQGSTFWMWIPCERKTTLTT